MSARACPDSMPLFSFSVVGVDERVCNCWRVSACACNCCCNESIHCCCSFFSPLTSWATNCFRVFMSSGSYRYLICCIICLITSPPSFSSSESLLSPTIKLRDILFLSLLGLTPGPFGGQASPFIAEFPWLVFYFWGIDCLPSSLISFLRRLRDSYMLWKELGGLP